jgi:hypothetical protein
MKHLVLALAALAPIGAVACSSAETNQSVSDAKSIKLVVSGMT